MEELKVVFKQQNHTTTYRQHEVDPVSGNNNHDSTLDGTSHHHTSEKS